MTAAAPVTAESILTCHAAGIAFVAEKPTATTISDFADQLREAVYNFDMAGINGTEELEDAATYLIDFDSSTDENERTVLLKKAADYLQYADDMAEEFRLMV
ncbi:hypothetical protein ACIQZB_43565 [Streptomyces sp. NPDC097727]|uniref:hypothetical protein n=1 Tax=Streptomyces sp. NPDC097727 TaxID=3366092 RepID=UPI0037FE1F40